MPFELKDLILDEVSAVDRPANDGARVLLLKSRGGERLWSGEGCREPEYEMVGRSESGVNLWRKRAEGTSKHESEEDSLAKIAKAKHDANDLIEKLAAAEFPRETKAAAVAKFLETDAGRDLYSLYRAADSARDAGVSFGKLAANLVLETKAAAIRKANPKMSPEAAYVEAMSQNPDVAAEAVRG
jgi:hypothetical protein